MPFPILRYDLPRLYFMHLPKSAGSSLESLLQAAYGAAYQVLPLRDLRTIDAAKLAARRCWASHLGPGLLQILPCDVSSVTLMRDPVERTISHINHVRREALRHTHRHSDEFQRAVVRLHDEDAEVWLDDPISAWFDNFATRYYGTTLDPGPWFRSGARGQRGEMIQVPFYPRSPTSDAELETVWRRACAMLDRMTVVGLTERFAESVGLIWDWLGVDAPPELPAENLGVVKSRVQAQYYRSRLAPRIVARIEARNRFDMMLYRHAARRFEAQLARPRRRARNVKPVLVDLVAHARRRVGAAR